MSDTSPSQIMCTKNPKHCLKCFSETCNDENRSSGAKSYCVQCAGNEDCPWGHEGTTYMKRCPNEVLLFQKESCFTFKNGSAVERGCTLDLEEETAKICKDPTSDACKLCDTNYCNNQNEVHSKCIQCNGEGCDKEQNAAVNGSQCNGVYIAAKKGCFTLKEGK